MFFGKSFLLMSVNQLANTSLIVTCVLVYLCTLDAGEVVSIKNFVTDRSAASW